MGSEPNLDILQALFVPYIKEDLLQRKNEKERMKAMEILNKVFIKFVVTKLNHNPEGDDRDTLLIFLNDIFLELFHKLKDIYCVLPALEILHDLLA